MNLGKRLGAEFFGTFWLVLGGCGSAVLAATVPELGIHFAGVALAFGLTVLTMAYALGPVSGGHFNPAVSVGLVAGGRFPIGELVPYIVAQVIGAIVAAGVLYLIASGKQGFDECVCNHSIAKSENRLPPPAQAPGLKNPCFGELSGNCSRKEVVKPFPQSRGCWVLRRRGTPVVAVNMGNPEVHVENASEEDEAERPLPRPGTVDHLVRREESEDACGHARRKRQANDLKYRRRRTRDHHCSCSVRGELKDDVDPRRPARDWNAR